MRTVKTLPFAGDFFPQIKHQLDATLCRFYFCRVTLHVSGSSAHHQEYLKLVQRPLVQYVITFSFAGYFFPQMKHQLDATLCRFYFCRVTLHVSGSSAHHREYLKLVQRPLVQYVITFSFAGDLSLKWNTKLMQHWAGFISAESLYMFRAQAPIIRSI